MNIHNHYNNSQSSCEVVSKYFNKAGMDESLSAFQEKKKKYTGPKSSQKQKTNKIKPRKTTKCVKDQKDIRTALKSKKNDLISYTKDFNEICKQSGVDVDSEQLQLAIALSKSLQSESQTDSNNSQSSESLNSQQRTGKIRTTLQEYGFKIPEIKITGKTLKKHKKQYKLLLTTEAEKQQVISDKYSQLLFKHLHNSKHNEISEQIDFTEIQLYHLATNVSYEFIKNNNIYYIENLIEKSSNSVGSLLKDWSEIPGRPISPSRNNNLKVKFCEIDCSHDDLNIILSGTLKSTKKILENKNLFQDNYLNMSKCESSKYIENVLKLENNLIEDLELCERTCKDFELHKENFVKINDQNTMEVRNPKVQATLTVSQEDRSISPDIFDDEESIVLENSKNNVHTISQQHDITVKVNNDFMDLTECANIASQSVLNKNNLKCKLNSQLPQGNNITKRISNDFMEITECVVTSTGPVLKNIQENTDLTPISYNTVTEKDNETKYSANTENIDLTQSSNSNDSLPLVNISGSKNSSLNDTIILNDEEINTNNQFTNLNSSENNKEEIILEQKEISHFKVMQRCSKSTNESVFEEYFYKHSDDSPEKPKENEIICLDLHETLDDESIYSKETDLSKNNDSNDIDLTQTSSSSEKDNSTSRSCSPKTPHDNKLGQKDYISIDYDELSDVNESVNYSKVQDGNPLQVTDCNKEFKENTQVINVTSNSIRNSDNNEWNNFTCKSKAQLPIENFNFGGISIIDDLSNVGSFNKSNKEIDTNAELPKYKFSRSMSDSFLPEVELKKECDNKNEDIKTPKPSNRNEVSTFKEFLQNTIVGVETPKNCDYIVKTDQVTPMLDYESMSTADMNKELDKYGLKPFKRKRAIQLLTHLYNQTHPFVESCSNEELMSPSKKRKQDLSHYSQTTLSKALKSPESPKQDNDCISLDKENNIYKVTNEVPDLKDIPCNTEDWVFQKREKAKVHSCRVPLHIAFHNYVSCRRGLREAILRYEPVDIDVIHKDLVTNGHRYDPKDLLRFMDKKCITVKTTDNNSRNNKRY